MSNENAIFDGNALTFSKTHASGFSIETPRLLRFDSYLTQSEGAIFKRGEDDSPERWFIPGAMSFTNGTPNEGKPIAFRRGIRRQVENGEFYRVIAADAFAGQINMAIPPFAMLLVTTVQAFLRLGSNTIWVGFHLPPPLRDQLSSIEKDFEWLMQSDEDIKGVLMPWANVTDWASLFQWIELSEVERFWACVETQRRLSVTEVQTSVHHLSVLLAMAARPREATFCLFGDRSTFRADFSSIIPGSTLLQDEPREAWTELTDWLFNRTGTRFFPEFYKSARQRSHSFERVLPTKLQWSPVSPSYHELVEAILHWKYLLGELKAPEELRCRFDNLIIEI